MLLVLVFSVFILFPLLYSSSLAAAQVIHDDYPLFVQGALEDATATDGTYNTGGTVTVNGFTATVPKNLLVQFPAAWVPWKDFVANKTDFLGFETLIMGNTILGEALVAQVVTTEFFEGLSFGYIQSINYTDGSMQIENGPVVRISDPNGVFSVGYDGAPFMTADDQSPSITSFSGFPMCIPRNVSDPLCPMSNRPTGNPSTFRVPDPYVMAPFIPDDFIVFSGFRKENEIIAFSIVAQNVQITTGDDIVYVRMELALLGIFNPHPASEIADSRLIGFVSNPRATVTLYAMDVDPCTGAVTNRLVAGVGLRGGRNFENKFEYRNEILFGYTREYRAVVEIDGRPLTRTTRNGLTAGTYVQPVNVWVPGEQDIPGIAPIPFEFSQMAFLTQGVGPDEEGNMWGPLTPFPQSNVVITPPDCEAWSEEKAKRESASLPLRKRKMFGSRISRITAVANAENKGTTEAEVEVAPDEVAAIVENEVQEEAKEEMELETSLE